MDEKIKILSICLSNIGPGTIKKLVKDYVLSVDMGLVRSNQNWECRLTSVLQKWLDVVRKVEPTCAVNAPDPDLIRVSHYQNGYPALYFVKQILPLPSKDDVKVIVRKCKK